MLLENRGGERNGALRLRLRQDARGLATHPLKVHADVDAPDRRVEDWSTLRGDELHVEKAPPAEPIPLTLEGT